MWPQTYDPFGNMLVSTAVAALPVVVLLGGIAILEIRAHLAAALGLVAAILVAIFAYGMPPHMAGLAAVYGAAFGLLPIGWIILNVIFLYQLTSEKGEFAILHVELSAHLNKALHAFWTFMHQYIDRFVRAQSCAGNKRILSMVSG